jgi:hypothetical protein
MAESTLKDVLNAVVTLTGAVGRLEKGQASLERGQREIRAEMATKKDLEAARKETRERFDAVDDRLDGLTSDVDALRAEMAERFDAQEEQIDTYNKVVKSTREDARDLEADVIALHKGLVRAKLPGVPKDLPSQVRAKGERPNKPAKRPTRRRERATRPASSTPLPCRGQPATNRIIAPTSASNRSISSATSAVVVRPSLVTASYIDAKSRLSSSTRAH